MTKPKVIEITEDNIKTQLALKLTGILKEPGIYMITHLPSGKTYVGSSKQMYKRMTQHITSLYNNKHHSYKLQNLFNSHGLGAFTFVMLELCSIEELFIREQHYIDSIPTRRRLNINKRADGSDYLTRTRRKKKNDTTTSKTTKTKRKTKNTI